MAGTVAHKESAPMVPAVDRQGGEARRFVIATLVMTGAFALAPFVGIYPIFLAKALCFALFACAFNLLLGFGGLLSFGHAMFLGTAAYFCAFLAKSGVKLETTRLFKTAG